MPTLFLKPLSRVCISLCHTRALLRHVPSLWSLTVTSPHVPGFTDFDLTGTSAAAWSVISSQHRARSTPIAHFERSCWACRLALRQARFRASRRGMK